VNCSITFSRNLNLLIEDDLSTFFQELARASYPLPVTTEDELNKLVHFGREFFPDSAFEISAGMTPIEERLIALIRRGEADKFLKNILPIICFLHTFRDDHDFMDKFKTRLANPPQFADTFFELKCLNHFHKNGFSFQYEPKVYDKGKEKHPDFRLTKDNIELFCECKQVRIGIAEWKFDEQCAYVGNKFPKNLQRQLFDAKLRLEVNFKRNLAQIDPDEVDELARQLNRFSSTQGMEKLPLQQLGDSIEYLVIPQNEPSPFPMMGRARTLSMQVTIGKPFRIGDPFRSPGGEIVFTSTDLARKRAEALGRNITEAKHQLPDDKLNIIILGRASLTIAGQAIKRRMNAKLYDNVIAFVVNPFEDFWVCYRTGYREVLFDLFEGFQQENPFKSK